MNTEWILHDVLSFIYFIKFESQMKNARKSNTVNTNEKSKDFEIFLQNIIFLYNSMEWNSDQKSLGVTLYELRQFLLLNVSYLSHFSI